MTEPTTEAGQSITIAVSATKRGWRVKVDASDGDRKTEAEAAGRTIALLAQVAVDMSAVAAYRRALAERVRGLDAFLHPLGGDKRYVDRAAVLALIEGEA